MAECAEKIVGAVAEEMIDEKIAEAIVGKPTIAPAGNQKLYYRLSKAAELMDVSDRTIKRWVERGWLQPHYPFRNGDKLGEARYALSDLLALQERIRKQSTDG